MFNFNTYCYYDKHIFHIPIFTVLNLSKLNKYTQLNRSRTELYEIFFEIFKNVVHSFKPGETPNISASHQASNYV